MGSNVEVVVSDEVVIEFRVHGLLLPVGFKFDRLRSAETSFHGVDILESLSEISPNGYSCSLFF